MICPKCGRDNPDDAIFCTYCGNTLKQFPAVSKKSSVPMAILAGCIVFMVALLFLGALGGMFYFYSQKKKLTRSPKNPPVTATTKVTTPTTQESSETLAKKTVEAFLQAILQRDYYKAEDYLSNKKKQTWDPEYYKRSGPEVYYCALDGFQILEVKKSDEGKVVVRVKETSSSDKALTPLPEYTINEYYLIEEEGRWLIDEVKFIENKYKEDTATGEKAWNVVGEFLNAVKENKLTEIPNYVTQNFYQNYYEYYYSPRNTDLFHKFELLEWWRNDEKTFIIQGSEEWGSETRMMEYRVIVENGRLLLDSVQIMSN